MNRRDFKQLSFIRLQEARVLLKNKNYEGAYYLCGYVIECAFKACIAKNTKRYDFPPDIKTVAAIYVHEPERLVKAAGLEMKLKDEMKRNRIFADNWGIVKDWRESSRYEKHNEIKVRNFFAAVADKKHGVLKWLKQYW